MKEPSMLLQSEMFKIIQITCSPDSTTNIGSTKNGGVKVVAPTVSGYTFLCPIGFYVDKTALAISRYAKRDNNVWLVFRNAASSTVTFGTANVDLLYINSNLITTSTQSASLHWVSSSSAADSYNGSAIWGAT